MKQINEETVLVVAPSIAQFEFHAAEKAAECEAYHRGLGWVSCDGVKYKYISNPHKMRGYRVKRVEYWGSWFDMPSHVIDEFRRLEQTVLLR